MLVKAVSDTFKLFDNLVGIQLSETLDANTKLKHDVHYFRQSELECTLLLVVGQLMMELSRLPIHVREDNMEILHKRLKHYEFNEYTYQVIKYLLSSIDQVPFMVEGDYLAQLHHTAKQLRHTNHKLRPISEIEQQSETINYFRTLVKQYVILNAILFNPTNIVTEENIDLLFEVLYSINNYANSDHMFYEGVPLKEFEHISPQVQARNEFIEFRFLSDIMIQHVFKLKSPLEPVKGENDYLDLLTAMEIIDSEGTVTVGAGFKKTPPTQETVTRTVMITDEVSLYDCLETIARFMDWNAELLNNAEWNVRFELIRTALLHRINQA